MDQKHEAWPINTFFRISHQKAIHLILAFLMKLGNPRILCSPVISLSCRGFHGFHGSSTTRSMQFCFFYNLFSPSVFVGYSNSKNRYCQIIWSTQSRHRNQHWVTYRLQELRLMRKSIFTSLWTLAFIQAKDHQSQIDQISEDFQTEFSYRGRMIIPARRPLSGSVTPSWYQTGGPTNLPPSLCKSSNSDKAVHRCMLENVC